MKETIMLGIDASSKKTGISVFANGKLKDYQLIDCSAEESMDKRLPLMSIGLLKVLKQYKPSIVYIEETSVARDIRLMRFLTRLQGVIYGWCITHKCEFNTVSPTSWRKKLEFKQGKNVSRENLKQQAIMYVKENFNVEVNDDIADAICIGQYVIITFEELTKEE